MGFIRKYANQISQECYLSNFSSITQHTHSNLRKQIVVEASFLHIGFPKTGSTFLQRRLLRWHPEIYSPMDLDGVAPEIYKIQGVKCSSDLDQIPYQLDRDLMNKLVSNKNQVTVISSEGFSEFLILPNIKFDRASYRQFLVIRYATIRKIFQKFGLEINIILVVRAQASAILSKYAEHRDQFVRFDKNFVNPQIFFETLSKSKSAETLLYHYDYVNHLDAIKVANCNYHVLVYEQLANDPVKFATKTSSILGINKQYSHYLLRNSTGMRVSIKDEKYTYYTSPRSTNDSKLDIQPRHIDDKVIQFFMSEECQQNIKHGKHHLNFELLNEIGVTSSPTRSKTSVIKNLKLSKVSLSKDNVAWLQNYYHNTNSHLDDFYQLNLGLYDYFRNDT